MPTRPDRAAARRLISGALERLPDRWFTRLQQAHLGSIEGGAGRVRRRALAGSVELARLRSLPVPEFQLFDYPDVRLHAEDSVVTRVAYWYGGDGYEGAETRWWRRACTRATHVLELGANIGYYTVHGAVANPACRYVAVEPHPRSAAALRRNLELNDLAHVEVLEAAAVGTVRSPRLELAVPDRDHYAAPAGAFLRAGGEGVDHVDAHQTVEVDVVAVADLIEGVDLLKLDIEGQEGEVLGSVFDVLCDTTPTIFLEVRLAEAPQLRRITAELADRGYVVFAIGTDSLHLVTKDQLDSGSKLPRYGTRDLMLVDARSVGDL